MSAAAAHWNPSGATTIGAKTTFSCQKKKTFAVAVQWSRQSVARHWGVSTVVTAIDREELETIFSCELAI